MSGFEAAAPTTLFVTKAGSEERLVTGIVLEPETVDAQGDIYSADEVRWAMYTFMESFQNVGRQHNELVNYGCAVVECWVQRDDTVMESHPIKAGTWMLTLRVMSDEIWADVKSGALSGFSIGGFAQKRAL